MGWVRKVALASILGVSAAVLYHSFYGNTPLIQIKSSQSEQMLKEQEELRNYQEEVRRLDQRKRWDDIFREEARKYMDNLLEEYKEDLERRQEVQHREDFGRARNTI